MSKAICLILDCDREAARRGWCHMHYLRWYRDGDPGEAASRHKPKPEPRPRPTVQERFWTKVVKTDTCWLWTGHLNSKGYGQLNVGKRLPMAHRLSYEWAVGEIPTGLVIDHLCRVRNCVNPDHLEPVTTAVNNARGLRHAERATFL